MEKSTQAVGAVSPVQPRLSQVLARLQPNQLECVYGTDPRRVSQVHGLIGQSAPLLILGDDAMGRAEMARSLLLQLAALDDRAPLRLAVLERTPMLAPLVQGLPHIRAVAADLPTLLPVLLDLEQQGATLVRERLSSVGKPLWVVVVCELHDHLQDANTARSLSSLIEQELQWGIHVIALSQCGVPELHELHASFKTWIAFATRAASCGLYPLLEESLLRTLLDEQQPGQFLLATGGDQIGGSLLVQPLRDIEAVWAAAGSALQLMKRKVSPLPCSVFLRLLGAAGEQQAGLVAAHVRGCPRCRHGFIPFPHAWPGSSTIDCAVCRERMPAYYEATHPVYPLVLMPDPDLLAVALHLASCPTCSEEWGVLVQLSTEEEEGA
jgi:hypothetical protein